MQWDIVGTVAGIMGAFLGVARWWTRAIIREENDKQLQAINGTYVRSSGSYITGAEIARRLERIEEKVDVVSDKVNELRGHSHGQ